MGYALEIRRVLARSLPEAFRSIPVRHLRPFVDPGTIRCAAMAPADVPRPNMAVLTPGSLSAHLLRACLPARAASACRWSRAATWSRATARCRSRRCGAAAGAHAAAPSRRLLRRSARAARRLSALGVTGLVEADAYRQDRARQCARLGRRRNAGADAVPRAAVPPSARPAAAAPARSTCGGWASPRAYAFAMAHLDAMIVRPCLGQDREPIIVGMLEPGRARRALEQRIASQPGHFWRNIPSLPRSARKGTARALAPAAVVLRCFVIADGNGYRVLPGGLAREPMGDTALARPRPAERHAEGRLGADRGRGRRATPAQLGAFISSRSTAAAPTCKAASPTISTGSAAISSGSTTMRACCAPR